MYGVEVWKLEVPPAMFLNSIRWRLQLWYGLFLVAVLAGFGYEGS